MQGEKHIHVEVSNAHENHKACTIIIDKSSAIKSVYCIECKKIVKYVFRKTKGWTDEKAVAWARSHQEILKSLNHISVDQSGVVLKVMAEFQDNQSEEYLPNSNRIYSFTKQARRFQVLEGGHHLHGHGMVELDESGNGVTEEENNHVHAVENFSVMPSGDGHTHELCPMTSEMEHPSTGGWPGAAGEKEPRKMPMERSAAEMAAEAAANGAKMEKFSKNVAGENLIVAKVDKEKRLVYGVFLWPDKADHDGDVISKEDIEKVAHGFMADYRTIDEMHDDVIDAEIVESAIAWQDDLDFHGKKLSKGAWFGAIRVNDDAVWEKIKGGEYQGFSVRISGVREPIEEGA